MITNRDNTISPWLLLILLFILQYVGFYCYLQREIVRFYPANYDQASYLPYVYTLYEKIKQDGFSILWHYHWLPTGVLFPLNALISFFCFGPSRFSALLPNFCYFIALQVIAFITAKKLSGKNAFGFICVGLILTLNTPFFIGGIADFRMDFIACSLYGIFTCMVLQSRLFLLRKLAILTGVIVAGMILMRFITLIYFSMLAFFLFSVFTLQFIFAQTAEHRSIAKKRFFHLMLACLIIGIMILPSLILTQTFLYQYYFIGHTKSIELPFRNLPPTETWLTFYPNIIKSIHIGKTGQLAIKTLLYFYGLLYILALLTHQYTKKTKLSLGKSDFGFLILAIVSPIFILSLDPAKSYVVGGIVDIPILLLVLLFCMAIDNQINMAKHHLINGVLACCILVLGLTQQYQSYMKSSTATQLNELATLNQMYADIANYATKHDWATIYLSLDYVTDYLNTGSFATLYYEKYGKFINIVPQRLGSALFSPITEKESIASLKDSNVVILTIGKYPDKSFFPGSQSITAFRPNLLQYAESHFHILGDYTFLGYHRRVYVS